MIVRSVSEVGRALKTKTVCPVTDCYREFEFSWDETQTFEVPLALFERRHFYRSELEETMT